MTNEITTTTEIVKPAILNIELSPVGNYELTFEFLGIKKIYICLFEAATEDLKSQVHVLVDFLKEDGGATLLAEHGAIHCMEIMNIVSRYANDNPELFGAFNDYILRTPNADTVVGVSEAYYRQVKATNAAATSATSDGFWFYPLMGTTAEKVFKDTQLATEFRTFKPTAPKVAEFVPGESPEYHSPFWMNVATTVNGIVYTACDRIWGLTGDDLPKLFSHMSVHGQQFMAEAVYRNVINLIISYQPEKEAPTTFSQKLFVNTITSLYNASSTFFLTEVDNADIDVALKRQLILTRQEDLAVDALTLPAANPTNLSDWI